MILWLTATCINIFRNSVFLCISDAVTVCCSSLLQPFDGSKTLSQHHRRLRHRKSCLHLINNQPLVCYLLSCNVSFSDNHNLLAINYVMLKMKQKPLFKLLHSEYIIFIFGLCTWYETSKVLSIKGKQSRHCFVQLRDLVIVLDCV